MPQDTSSARTLARRLIARDATAGSDTGPVPVVAACERTYRELERFVGPAGCHALFARALVQVRPTHAALGGVRLREESPFELDQLAESVAAFGPVAVATALEDVLVALLALLGRMIGDDLSEQLLDPRRESVTGTPPAPAAAARPTPAPPPVPPPVPEPGAPRAAPDASQQ